MIFYPMTSSLSFRCLILSSVSLMLSSISLHYLWSASCWAFISVIFCLFDYSKSFLSGISSLSLLWSILMSSWTFKSYLAKYSQWSSAYFYCSSFRTLSSWFLFDCYMSWISFFPITSFLFTTASLIAFISSSILEHSFFFKKIS